MSSRDEADSRVMGFRSSEEVTGFQRAALSVPPAGYVLVPKVWLDAVSGFIPPGAMASLAAAPQPPAEPRERVLLCRWANETRWEVCHTAPLTGPLDGPPIVYRYATLDPKEGEQT